MLTHELGNSRLQVSVLAIGTAALSGHVPDWGSTDDNEAVAAIHRAIDGGINLIDTSPAYGNGRAETLVGRAVRGRRDHVLLATRCGRVPVNGDGGCTTCLAPDSIIRECEASLRRLQTDHIDLYQCHEPDPNIPIRQTMEALADLVREGKVRFIGLGHFGCQEIAAAAEYGRICCVQTPLSLLNRRAATDLIPFCQELNLGVLAHSPLAMGLLAGGYGPDSRITGIRSRDLNFKPPRFARNLAFVEKLREIARGYGKTVGQLAVRWVLRQPGVTTAVFGATRPSQVEEILAAVGWDLAPEDDERINALLQEL